MNDSNVTSRIEYFYALPFEKNFDNLDAYDKAKSLFVMSCCCVPAYLLATFAGQVYMRKRPAYDLRPLLILWNAVLALGSAWGSLRVVPELFHVLKHFGFRYSVCVVEPEVANPVTGFWYFAFALSKFLELGDTAFLVLRKKKVIFLHWFHHSSVLVLTFLLSSQRAPICRWFGSMNMTVHSFMYAYFALQAAGWRLPRWISLSVTAGQIVQMLAGSYVSFRVFLFWLLDEPCSNTASSVNAAVAVYSVYLSLFLNFFYQTYFKHWFLPSRVKTD